MADISTIWSPSLGAGDWYVQVADDGTLTDETGAPIIDGTGFAIEDGFFDGVTDLQAGDDLFTAVLISLFTDATASDDDVIPDGSNDPRGWWGDIGETVGIGSKLWLRDRSKQTALTLELVRNDIVEALQWLIDDQVAASVTVTAEWSRPGFLGSLIIITRTDGSLASMQFDWAWKEQR